jgi:serine/threonine-protein kinase
VPSPNSCIRCSKPLAVDSPGGLCPECAATERTPAPTVLVRTPVGADPSAQTRTGRFDAATASAEPDLSAATLPPAPAGYDLLERLGFGGMGAVYLAREQAAERLVAMKFLHHAAGPVSLDRFLVELRVLAKLDHPNIVRVFASDFLRADPFFTMEYVPGGSLGRAVESAGPLPPAEAVRVIRAVAGAVRAAHEQGVVHRDLKPSNILLSADGTPKVSDFGLAKQLDRDDALTVGSGALGTPSYMPPEQISSKNGELGPWSDVYGLGATLYHLLTGRAPFPGTSAEGIIPQVLADPPERPRAVRPDIPMPLEAVVVKCLEKDPKDRYQSIAEFVADLDRAQAEQKTVAPPLTRWRRARRWASRHRRGIVAGAMAVLLLAGVFALGAAVRPRPKPSADPPPDETAELRKQLEALRQELAAGRAATPVPKVGLPGWREWRVAGTGPTTNAALEGACYIEAIDYALLDVLPAVGLDRYRVTLEFRHVAEIEPAAAPGALVARPSAAFVGLYLADERRTGADGTTFQPLLAITLNDLARVGVAKAPQTHAALLRDALMSQRPEKPFHLDRKGIAQHLFTPSPGIPGPWRKLRLEITPDDIRARWGNPDGTFTSFKPLESGFSVAARQTDLQQRMNAVAPGAAAPPWDPARLTVGVLCHRSGLAVRNLTVEPIP